MGKSSSLFQRMNVISSL